MRTRIGQAAVGGQRSAVVILSLLLFTGCDQLKLAGMGRAWGEGWTTEGGNAQRQQAGEGTFSGRTFVESWRYDADAGFSAGSPLAVNGIAFISTRKGEVYALDVASGKKRGMQKLADSVEGTPAMDGSVLYVPNGGDGRALLAFDVVAGKKVWERKGASIASGLLLTGSLLLAATTDGAVWALDKATGAEVWTSRLDGNGYFATPVLVDETAVAVVDDGGTVRLLCLTDGAEVWTVETGAPVYDAPAADGNLLYVPTTRGQLLALDTRTGAERWRYEASSSLVRVASPAVKDGLLVVGGSDAVLVGLDAATGAERWRFRAEGNFSAAPLIAGGLVFAGSMDKHLYVLDAETGVRLEQHEVRGRIKSAPMLHRETVLVLSEPKFVYAFRVSHATMLP